MSRIFYVCLVAVAMSAMLAAPFVSAAELDELLQATLEHPGVSASQQQVLAAQANLQAARRRYWGSGGLQAEQSHYDDPRFVGMFTADALANPPFADRVNRYGLFYQLPIDLSGTIAAGRRAAEQDFDAAQLQARQTRLLKLHDGLSAYVRLQALQTQQQAVIVQRQRVEQTLQRVSEMVRTEQAAHAELSLARAEVARLRADEVRLQGQAEQTGAALMAATGQSLLPSSSTIGLPDWPAAKPDNWLPVTLSESKAVAAQAQAESARRSLWPQLALGGDVSRFDGAGYEQDTWRLAASVTLPLNPAAHQRSRAASAQAEAARFAQQATRREAEQQWTALMAAYRSAWADAQAADEEVRAREEVVTRQLELQRVGLSSLEELLRQQRDLLDAVARRAAAQARVVESWSAAQVLAGSKPQDYIATVVASAP